MALEKIRLGTNEDGSPHYLYRQTDPTKGVLITGPITGSVSTSDGTVYDVSELAIEVEPHHAGEVACAIGKRHEAEGHPGHQSPDDPPFVHECTDHCAPKEA